MTYSDLREPSYESPLSDAAIAARRAEEMRHGACCHDDPVATTSDPWEARIQEIRRREAERVPQVFPKRQGGRKRASA